MRARLVPQLVLALPRFAKRFIVLAVDASLCVVTVWLVLSLRLELFVPLSGKTAWAASLAVVCALPVFAAFGLYRAIFRYSGWATMLTLLRAMAVYTLIYGTFVTVISFEGIPRTLGLLQPLLLCFGVGGSRVLARYWLGGVPRHLMHLSQLPNALIYGAGSAGRQLASALADSPEMRVVGFVDDDSKLHGQALNGQPIYAPSTLTRLIEAKGITHVLLAIPSASRRRRNHILQQMSQYRVAVRTLPSMTDLAEGRVTISDLHDLDVDDLLGREALDPHPELLAKHVQRQVVLVTGAGGSIGSELCRQIIKLRPQTLLLVDISEYALYAIHAELEELSKAQGLEMVTLVPLLASVQDSGRMDKIIQAWKPHTLYHAAAYKHVPLVEHNVVQGIANNVFGTLATAQAALSHGVLEFVLVSTDKAVRPTNLMGASKRLAEQCLQALFTLHQGTPGGCRFSMVRFGNVLDSSGSVIPRFQKQIRSGQALTVTHPQITRYFMTIPEAALLVIQAGALAQGGDVFVLDMGEPVKIMDLARRMVELSGLSVRDANNPDGDIEITITGLRPGEKLYEELLLGTNPQPTAHPKIMRAQEPAISWSTLQPQLEELKQLLDVHQVDTIVQRMRQLVPEYQPHSEVVDWVFIQENRYNQTR